MEFIKGHRIDIVLKCLGYNVAYRCCYATYNTVSQNNPSYSHHASVLCINSTRHSQNKKVWDLYSLINSMKRVTYVKLKILFSQFLIKGHRVKVTLIHSGPLKAIKLSCRQYSKTMSICQQQQYKSGLLAAQRAG